MKLLLDEMFPPRLAAELRKRGHDVAAVAERAELRSHDDEAILSAATADDRVLVTEDVTDFIEITTAYASDGRPHGGVVLVSSNTFPRNERALGVLVRAIDALLNDHEGDRTVPASVEWLRRAPADRARG